MMSKIWRLSHLALAILSSLVLVIASVTGGILAVDAAWEKTSPYKIQDIDELELVQFLPGLRIVFSEITSIEVDHNDFVLLEGYDEQGNEIKSYIDPRNGMLLGQPEPKHEFIEWTTALHRSLFLKETGRFIVGIASFFFFLLTITGIVLLVKRQNGWRRVFAKVTRDFNSQYLHVAMGRWMLLPLLLLSLTATYLFMVRFELLPAAETKVQTAEAAVDLPTIPLAEFDVFSTVRLGEVEKIDFPFMEDPEEFYVLKLKDRELTVDQFNGAIVKEEKYPMAQRLEALALEWHAGRTHWLLALVLGIASFSVLGFIYSGFDITYKRSRKTGKNTCTADQAELILLVGSENGTTKQFASKVLQQLQAMKLPVYLEEMNNLQVYPKATRMLIFTSTYGQGDAPYTANQFVQRLKANQQPQSVGFSVVGFGSKQYEDFCGFAKEVDCAMAEQTWAVRELPLYTVDQKSTTDFAQWTKAWTQSSGISIASTASSYSLERPKLTELTVVENREFQREDSTVFQLKLTTKKAFQSGDLLAIYPTNDAQERLYSIGKVNGQVQLVVRLHPGGIGSTQLYNLREGQRLKARILSNPSFHFPTTAQAVAMIANGTGIAPFLGMLDQNTTKVAVQLYAGFRNHSMATCAYNDFALAQKEKGQLQELHLAFSREGNACYVMDLIRKDADYFAQLIGQKGVIMLCGSLAMQKDVEAVLVQIAVENHLDFELYKAEGLLKTDCY